PHHLGAQTILRAILQRPQNGARMVLSPPVPPQPDQLQGTGWEAGSSTIVNASGCIFQVHFGPLLIYISIFSLKIILSQQCENRKGNPPRGNTAAQNRHPPSAWTGRPLGPSAAPGETIFGFASAYE